MKTRETSMESLNRITDTILGKEFVITEPVDTQTANWMMTNLIIERHKTQINELKWCGILISVFALGIVGLTIALFLKM